MSSPLLAESNDALLSAAVGVCDTGYGWVATALASGLAEYSPTDLQELEAAMKTPTRSSKVVTKIETEMRSRLDRLVPASINVHEETHFYQLISTPYGRLASEIERYWIADLVKITNALASTDAIEPGSLPLRAWVDHNLATHSRSRVIAEYAELAYTQTNGVKCALSGSPFVGFLGHRVPDLTVGDALNSWPDFLCAQDRAEDVVEDPNLRIQQVTHPSLLTTNFREDFPAAPVVRGVTVSPRAIFEGAALEIQLSWVRGVLDDATSAARVLRVLNSGFIDGTYLTTRHVVAALLPTLAWPSRRSVLLTLSDLALWGPTHRDYVGGDDREVAWEDLHPGYRFVRALQVLAENRAGLTVSDLGDRSAVTEVVCRELRWITPAEMAQNYLESDAPDAANSPVGDDVLGSLRIRAAKARLAEPAMFIDATNEAEIHTRFDLVMPFIVEQGRLRMPDSPELVKLLFASTVSHLAHGVFDGKLSRLFHEPQNVSDMIHSAALEAYFGERGTEFAHLMSDASDLTPVSRLSSDLPRSEIHSLKELSQWLRREGLAEFSRAVRTITTYEDSRAAAVDWFLRQPTIVEAVLGTREMKPDGSFTVRWPSLYGVLGEAIRCTDVDSLKELFEDCGYHYFNRDIDDLQRWSAGPRQ